MIPRIVLALMLAMVAVTPAAAEEIVVALTDSTPNFSMRDANGSTTGINVELAALLCSRMQVQCTFKPMPLVALIAQVRDGKAHIGFANLIKTPEREQVMLFSRPYWRSSTAFVGPSRLAGTPLETLLQGRKVAVQEGSRQANWLKTQFGDQVEIIALPTISDIAAALAQQQAELALAPMMTLYPFLLSPAGGSFGFVSAPIDPGWPVHVVVTKTRPELLRRLDRALEEVKHDGSLGRITRSYVPFDIF